MTELLRALEPALCASVGYIAHKHHHHHHHSAARTVKHVVKKIPKTISKAVKESNEIRREEEKENRELNKASKVYDDKLSSDIKSDINRMSSGSETSETLYRLVAKSTNRWVNYALYYMTHFDAKLLDGAKTKDKELVNGVAELAGFGKIFKDADIADLTKYEAKYADCTFKRGHLLNIDDIKKRINEPRFQINMATRIKMAEITNTDVKLLSGPIENPSEYGSPLDKDFHLIGGSYENGKLAHAIFIDNNAKKEPVIIKQDPSIDDATFQLFEGAFVDNGIIDPFSKYQYHRDYLDNFVLTTYNPDAMYAESNYLIDNGRIMGGSKVSILCSFELSDGTTDTIFVDVNRHPDIVKKVVKNIFYRLNAKEVEVCMNDCFDTMSVYHYIDFSDTKWLDDMNALDKKALDHSFAGVINVLNKESLDCRLRFKTYEAPDKFTLISDEYAVSTLSQDNTTSGNICYGLEIEVNGKYITKHSKGENDATYEVVAS